MLESDIVWEHHIYLMDRDGGSGGQVMLSVRNNINMVMSIYILEIVFQDQ